MKRRFFRKISLISLAFMIALSSPSYADESLSVMTGGYIPMPWEYDVEMPDEDVSLSEVQYRLVDNKGSADTTDYSPRANLPSCYPASWSDEAAMRNALHRYPAVRNQGVMGACWSFCSTALAEFFDIKNHNKPGNYDLSEQYLASAIYKEQINPVVGNEAAAGSIESNASDAEKLLNIGGSPQFAAQFLLKSFGFVDESEFPYIGNVKTWGEYYSHFDQNGNFPVDFNSFRNRNISHLSNVYIANINSINGRKMIKEAIMRNGAATIQYYQEISPSVLDNAYYVSENGAYYCSDNKNQNHAVTVVGWDDDYPKTSFKTPPTDNGAWLIRGSYGDSSAPLYSIYNYYWVSYYDKSIISASYIFETTGTKESYDRDYYYDSQFYYPECISKSSTVANIYTVGSDSNEYLTEVVLPFTDSKIHYSVDIYTDLQDADDPVSGTRIENAANGEVLLQGIFTIPLKERVLLKKGSRFSVVVTSDRYSVAYESEFDNRGGNGKYVTFTPGIKKGQSFIYSDGRWTDWSERSNGNFCISAHTVYTDDKGDDIVLPPTEEVEFKDDSGQPVTLIRNREYNTYKTSDGKDVLVFSKDDGKPAEAPKYQFTGKRITPSRKSFIVFNGILYEYNKDYRISFKKNKNRGKATAIIKWKKGSVPYQNGKRKTSMDFQVVERSVSEDQVSFTGLKKNSLKNLKVRDGDLTMKPKKKDYSFTLTGNTVVIDFKNDYKGTVKKEQ